jgi:prophage regulatory protein
MTDKLLGTEQAAERLSTPIATLRYWIVRGEAPDSFKIGRRRMFRESAIEKFIADREKASA